MNFNPRLDGPARHFRLDPPFGKADVDFVVIGLVVALLVGGVLGLVS